MNQSRLKQGPGACGECREINQYRLDRWNAEFDRWKSLTDRQRGDEIRRAGREFYR